MGLIEAILIGLQLDRLQKPLVFFSMLIGFSFFLVAGVGVLYGVSEVVLSDKEGKEAIIGPLIGMVAFSLLFFGLAAVCGHFIKKCVR
ncbi:hypothetical protein [Aliiglaciecola litoralis]|uniref:Uncharacterized protein n=1 Tax=Aliiglaciecola litoralis TaxID=582857 RepID=A0ABN1LUB0_9ALTE